MVLAPENFPNLLPFFTEFSPHFFGGVFTLRRSLFFAASTILHSCMQGMQATIQELRAEN